MKNDMSEQYPKTVCDIPGYVSPEPNPKPERFGWQWVESAKRCLIEGGDPETLFPMSKGELVLLGLIRRLSYLDDLQWIRDNYYKSKVLVKGALLSLRENLVIKRRREN